MGDWSTNASAINTTHTLRDALPPECLANTYPVALLSRVYDPLSIECLTDPNFFMDLEVRVVICHAADRYSLTLLCTLNYFFAPELSLIVVPDAFADPVAFLFIIIIKLSVNVLTTAIIFPSPKFLYENSVLS